MLFGLGVFSSTAIALAVSRCIHCLISPNKPARTLGGRQVSLIPPNYYN